MAVGEAVMEAVEAVETVEMVKVTAGGLAVAAGVLA